MRPSPTVVQNIVRVSLVGAALLVAFTVRVVTSAHAELQEGDGRMQSKDVEGAVVHYRRAARWYAPGSPYHVTALGKLARIGAQAERDGDTELALSAYRAVRAAIMSTRSFYVPEVDRLAAANARIADLMASLPPPPMDAGKSREQLRREHLALLEEDRDPSTLWTLVLLVGFFGWVVGGFAFTVHAIDQDDRWVPAEARRWGSVIVVGFALFVLGLALA